MCILTAVPTRPWLRGKALVSGPSDTCPFFLSLRKSEPGMEVGKERAKERERERERRAMDRSRWGGRGRVTKAAFFIFAWTPFPDDGVFCGPGGPRGACQHALTFPSATAICPMQDFIDRPRWILEDSWKLEARAFPMNL